jgi:hypothetical protein
MKFWLRYSDVKILKSKVMQMNNLLTNQHFVMTLRDDPKG